MGKGEPDIALVAAVARNGIIGDNGGMPWRMSSDLRHFKAVTMGKPIIMGRKTFESLGRPLPGRPHVVITRNGDYAPDGVEVAGGLEAALERGRELAAELGVDEIMVIGGGEIYRQAMERARRIYLTELDLDVAGDTAFPEIDRDRWREVSREQHEAGEKDCADYAFVVLERQD